MLNLCVFIFKYFYWLFGQVITTKIDSVIFWKIFMTFTKFSAYFWCHDTLDYSIQDNDTLHNDTEYDDTQHNYKETALSMRTLTIVSLCWVSFMLSVYFYCYAECHLR